MLPVTCIDCVPLDGQSVSQDIQEPIAAVLGLQINERQLKARADHSRKMRPPKTVRTKYPDDSRKTSGNTIYGFHQELSQVLLDPVLSDDLCIENRGWGNG